MPLLEWDGDLPRRPERVLVVGVSGSGKTTLARRVAVAWDLERVELDALHHGPGWQPRPTFVAEVEAFARTSRWVTEWQYTGELGRTLTGRADCVLWLDHRSWLVMWQVVARTLSRRLRREVLWNGNVEPPLWTLLTDPEHVVRWAWRTRGKPRRHVAALLEERGGQVTVVRLRGRRRLAAWTRRHLDGTATR